MRKLDFTYPLPPESLYKRYDELFNAFKKGLSVNFIGLPKSARSGYLRFIISTPIFLKEFLNPNEFKFVFLEPEEIINGQSTKLLAAKFIQAGIDTADEKIASLIVNPDPLLLSVFMQKAIEVCEQKIVIIVYEAEIAFDKDPELPFLLSKLWETKRTQPDSKVNLCLVASPVFLENRDKGQYEILRMCLEEKIIYFPLFDNSEMNYLKNRIEHFTGNKISEKKHKQIVNIADGHTVLYRILSNLSEKELDSFKDDNVEIIAKTLKDIWDAMPINIKQNWSAKNIEKHKYLKEINIIKNGKIRIKGLPFNDSNKELVGNVFITNLTAQQKVLFDYFKANKNKVLTRDEIAQVIWGNQWGEKYSDWAIDQTIHKLKKKLINTPDSILTLRNRGYQFTDK